MGLSSHLLEISRYCSIDANIDSPHGLVCVFSLSFAGDTETFRRIPPIISFAKIHLDAAWYTATLLGCNWFVFIYGVNTNQVIESSLGYFINPLLVILLGAVFLKESLNIWQIVAVGFAALGVLNFLWNFGSLPWIALSLAFTFSFYGLFRKMIPVKPLVGLLMETALLAPLAAVLIVFWEIDGTGSFGNVWKTDFLLIGAGVVTSLPLLWFTNAGKRLRYSTMGFIQYLTPSIQLVIGIYLYNEPFTSTHAVTFGLIWTGLLVYSFNAFQQQSST